MQLVQIRRIVHNSGNVGSVDEIKDHLVPGLLGAPVVFSARYRSDINVVLTPASHSYNTLQGYIYFTQSYRKDGSHSQ